MHILNSVLLLPLTIRMVLGAAIGLDKRDNGGDLGSKLKSAPSALQREKLLSSEEHVAEITPV